MCLRVSAEGAHPGKQRPTRDHYEAAPRKRRPADDLRLVALGCIVFPSDGVGRVVRVDSPGPTPDEEAAIERRLAAIRPMVLDALDAVMGEE
ncbi:MAG: hypothetical protein AB2L07_00445 [Thermoanaerobaculaceae bacterium]